MSSRRRQLPDIPSTREVNQEGIFGELTQSPREAAEIAAREAAENEARTQAESAVPQPESRLPEAATPPPAMTMEEIQAVPKSDRRPTNFGLPNALNLHMRMTYYKLLYGVPVQDQHAMAADKWLREQGH